MPLYVVRCADHGEQEVFRHGCTSVKEAPCPICGTKSPRVFKNGCGMPEPFVPYWTESLAPRPVYIESRKQERAIEKKHNLQRVY